MMRIHVLTLCHMMPEMIAFSLAKGLRTMGMDPHEVWWTLVDHHWPIDRENTSAAVDRMASMVYGRVISPEKNLGGIGGANWAVAHMGVADDDIVIGYDPDSNPLTHGWGKALVDVMQADASIKYLSLMNVACVNNRQWKFREVGGHRLARDSAPEMYNVTAWRGSFIKKGLPAPKFYGGIEAQLFDRGDHGEYLFDFREGSPPFPHPQCYTDWKRKNDTGAFTGNFDEYVAKFPPTDI